MSEEEVTNVNYTVRTEPLYRWECRVLGTSLVIQREKAPNIFHRTMQRLMFGFKWRRINRN